MHCFIPFLYFLTNYPCFLLFRKFFEAKLCLRARVLDCKDLDTMKPILDLWADLEARWGITCTWKKCTCPTCEMDKINSCTQSWRTAIFQAGSSNRVCRYCYVSRFVLKGPIQPI